MKLVSIMLLLLLIACCVSVYFQQDLIKAVVIYMSFSLIMSVVWLLLESADLAITEAAVGAGVDTVLYFVALKKIHAIRQKREDTLIMEEQREAEMEEKLEAETLASLPESESVHSENSQAEENAEVIE